MSLQKQSDYMSDWMNNKRSVYLDRILQMKAGRRVGNSQETAMPDSCSRCGVGKAVWRCLDCMDRSDVCVLCCRNAHGMNVFHRVEKWNGRHYQQGALWQIGVKIHTGHNGSPCPRRLYGQSGVVQEHRLVDENTLEDMAEKFGKSQADILSIVSEALEHPPALMSQIECDVLKAIADKSGKSILDLLVYLKRVVSRGAEQDADDLQASSDHTAAEDEGGTEAQEQLDGVPILLEEDGNADIDDWEDEDERPLKGHVPRFIPRAPPADGAGNKFLTIVHTNGFHVLPVVWCTCPNNSTDRDLQLLDLQLYPASVERISTAFTFQLLDDHRYDYLECKSSRYQFHNKLRRLTCPLYPDGVPSRYVELGRVSRQWRNLKYRKWFWILDNLNAKRGSMALFCAACPQDGVNLPADWQDAYTANPYVFHDAALMTADPSTDTYS